MSRGKAQRWRFPQAFRSDRWVLGEQEIVALFVVPDRGVNVGLDHGGADGIHADFVGCQLVGRVSRKAEQPGL